MEDGVMYRTINGEEFIVPPPGARKDIVVQMHRVSHATGRRLKKQIMH